MPATTSPLPPHTSVEQLRQQLLDETTTPTQALATALARANANAGANVYLALDAGWSQHEAERLEAMQHEAPSVRSTQPLWGIPVSLKDCFDLTGFRTSCGARYYMEHTEPAAADSTVAARLRAAGAVITGKTHLHQLAYGITGENADFGDCVQPRNAAGLTGGSSSGAAASVQEDSALAAIGTDTGGSIRVPAALCGLAGYRSSITLNTPTANAEPMWRGGGHLAPSFDTVGWIYRSLSDGPLLGHALFNLPLLDAAATDARPLADLRIGIPDAGFLHDCEAPVLDAFAAFVEHLRARGAQVETFDAAPLAPAFEILAPIQASEAAALHKGLFQHFEPAIAERLAWGASLSSAALAPFQQRLADFRAMMQSLLTRFDHLLLPCAPMTALLAGHDQTETRKRILRYTAPVSLAGLPVVTLPLQAGGLQLVGPLGSDATLLARSATLGL
jgi:aspartyl-tRNA(Asn)/glutamyl-tRNA(Gln) amidotransferase subunit A